MTTIRRSLCVLLLAAAPALGQSAPGALDPSRLPSDTLFYLHWRGTASLERARTTNSLLRLWADPGFAPVRQALSDAFYSNARKNKDLASSTPADLEQILSLAENAALIGWVGNLDLSALRGGQGNAGPARLPAFFVIFDTTGKAELITKLESKAALASKEPRSVTHYAFGPTTVETTVKGGKTSYRAMVGPYWIHSDERTVIEDLIRRIRSPEPPKTSLGEIDDYRSARRQMDNEALMDFLLRIPDLTQLPIPAQQGFDTAALLRALHFEKLHSLSGSLSFVGPATRIRAALLGDTSAGGILDLGAGDNHPTFETLALAPAGTTSFNAGFVNLSALYETLRRALFAALPPQQRTRLEQIEALMANHIGVEIPDALRLLRGEAASLATPAEMEPPSQLYAATIQNPAEVLRVLRIILAARIVSEEPAGDATLLKLSTFPLQSSAGNSRPQTYSLGIAPRMLLAAPREESVREGLKRLAAKDTGDAGSLAGDARFRKARGRFPASLTGLGYVDFTGIPWERISDVFEEGLQKANTKSAGSAAARKEWMKKLSLVVLRRYLHTMASGSWKDRDGGYFDAWIE